MVLSTQESHLSLPPTNTCAHSTPIGLAHAGKATTLAPALALGPRPARGTDVAVVAAPVAVPERRRAHAARVGARAVAATQAGADRRGGLPGEVVGGRPVRRGFAPAAALLRGMGVSARKYTRPGSAFVGSALECIAREKTGGVQSTQG